MKDCRRVVIGTSREGSKKMESFVVILNPYGECGKNGEFVCRFVYMFGVVASGKCPTVQRGFRLARGSG